MNLLFIALSAIFSFAALFLLTKWMGHRQISEMSMFDYITGITIGSIAAELSITDYHKSAFWEILIAIIIYAALTTLLSFITDKSLRARKWISGLPCILFHNGNFHYENLKKARIDASEFISQCRINGYFDLSQIQTALMEPNGKISFLPVSDERPLTPRDMQLKPKQEPLPYAIIMDGQIIEANLQRTGKDRSWLQRQLKAQGIDELSEVFLAMADSENTCHIFPKQKNT